MGTGCSAGYALDPGIGQIPSFKIVLVGDAETGKTSVFLRYFKNQFDYSYRPTTTVSIENVVKKLNVPEHTVVSIAMWDLPGREEMDLRKSYYKDVDAAIVVVNIADEESVELANTWRQDILNHAVVSKKSIVSTPEGSKVVTDYEPADHTQIPVLLIGNKYDLVEDRQALQEENNDEDESRDIEKPLLIEDNRDADTRSLPEKHEDEDGDDEKAEDANNGREMGGGGGDGSSLGGEKMDREVENVGKEEDSREEKEEDSMEADGKKEEDSRDRDGKKDGEEEKEREKGGVTVWKYEEQQEEEEPPPPEIQFLEECAEKYGFVGSVAVSAKNADGSVHAAIQALIRHLIELKLKDSAKDKMAAVSVKRTKVKRTKLKKKKDPKAFEPLEKTAIKELDNLFNKANRHMSLIHDTRLAYRQAVKLFKAQCTEAEMVDGPKCSMEDCVSGLKAAMAKDDLELLAQDDNGYIQLVVQGEEMKEDDKSLDMRDLMNTFHSEVAVASRTILHECPTAVSHLQRLDAQIEAECRGAIERASRDDPLTTRELKRIQDAVDMNRARIKNTSVHAQECLQDVESSYKKIKAAMIW